MVAEYRELINYNTKNIKKIIMVLVYILLNHRNDWELCRYNNSEFYNEFQAEKEIETTIFSACFAWDSIESAIAA